MAYDNEKLNRIYERTDGYCHVCCKKLSFVNYAQPVRKGAWEVEHSRPRAKGGTNHLNNLYPACITCNRDKGTVTTQTARSWKGRKRAPLSKEKKKREKKTNAVAGGILGGLIGSVFGPWGTAAGVSIGAKLAYDDDPNDQ